jgi:hypothetical protein
MNWPPMLMHVKVKNEKSDFGFWLPLFLLFPLALVVLIILSPLIIIGIIVLCALGYGRWVWFGFRCLWMAVMTSWALRGLKVDVQNNKQQVFVSIV